MASLKRCPDTKIKFLQHIRRLSEHTVGDKGWIRARLQACRVRTGKDTPLGAAFRGQCMPVPEQYAIFPVINATLNGASTILLLVGRWLISQRRIAQHRLVMLTAFATSTLFLLSYLYS